MLLPKRATNSTNVAKNVWIKFSKKSCRAQSVGDVMAEGDVSQRPARVGGFLGRRKPGQSCCLGGLVTRFTSSTGGVIGLLYGCCRQRHRITAVPLHCIQHTAKSVTKLSSIHTVFCDADAIDSVSEWVTYTRSTQLSSWVVSRMWTELTTTADGFRSKI